MITRALSTQSSVRAQEQRAPVTADVRVIMSWIGLFFVIFCGLWPQLSGASSEKDCPLSANVEQLLKNKKQYDQKMACVTGRLRVKFEANQLSLGKSKVWLEFFGGPEYTDESIDRDEKRVKAWERLYQNQCVVVRGRFNLKQTGHLGMWPAGIDNIESVTRAGEAACSPDSLGG